MKSLIKTLIFSISITIGCGTDEKAEENSFDLVGDWNGDWQGGTISGNVIATITQQNDETYIGTAFLDGNPCITNGILLGHVDLETGETTLLFLDPTLSDEELQTFNPQDPATYLLREHIIEMQGEFSELGHASMTYNVIEWSFCTDAFGTFNISRE